MILLGIPGGPGGSLVNFAFKSTASTTDQKSVGNQTAKGPSGQQDALVKGHKLADKSRL